MVVTHDALALSPLHDAGMNFTAWFCWSATKAPPLPSGVTPRGKLMPPPYVTTHPLFVQPGGILFTASWFVSPTQTYPDASTPIPCGALNPPPMAFTHA